MPTPTYSTISPPETAKPSYEKLSELLRQRHAQLEGLLKITEAINNNAKHHVLFEMYEDFLKKEMGVGKIALFVRRLDGVWNCVLATGVKINEVPPNFEQEFSTYQEPCEMEDEKVNPIFHGFKHIIPVWHKNHAIAYAFITEMEAQNSESLQFVITLTNIVAVAIENKRLFKQQLEQERLHREMELAHDMQMMFVPSSFPKRSNYQLASIYKPHFSIGGDYFDFFELDNNKIAFCIADISGKGIAAALLMSNFQANLHTLVAKCLPVQDFIRKLNDAVVGITKGDRFITFFWAEFDLISRRLEYINAGHTPPVLVMNHSAYLLDKGCTILGSFNKLPSIETGEMFVTAREAMILTYTDGLTDIADKNGAYFNDDILSNFVLANADLSAEEFNTSLMEQVDIFRGDQDYPDDFTVLTCKLTPTASVV